MTLQHLIERVRRRSVDGALAAGRWGRVVGRPDLDGRVGGAGGDVSNVQEGGQRGGEGWVKGKRTDFVSGETRTLMR